MCDQCEELTINGVRCHETGCPVAWRDQSRECKECGCDFTPEIRHQQFCGDQCAAAYHGLPDPDDDGQDDDGE